MPDRCNADLRRCELSLCRLGANGFSEKYFVHPVSVHVHPFKAPPIPQNVFTCLRDMSKAIDDETTQRFKVLVFLAWQRRKSEAAAKVVHLHAAIDEPRTVIPLNRLRLASVSRFGQVAHDGLQGVNGQPITTLSCDSIQRRW